MSDITMTNAITSLNMALPIECQDLHLSYRKKEILKGIDFTLEQGSVLGLIGKNGAGKSTLIQCLMGLLQPQQGSAHLFGCPSLNLSTACKQRLAYVPQQNHSFTWMTVEDSLNFVSSLYEKWDGIYAETLVKQWDIPLKENIDKLSPGQEQRLALVRALAPRPALLVLDEPASALDPLARRDLLREVVEHACDDGTTVLFSTHIVSDLERVSSRVAFLDEGQLLLNHTLDDLKEQVIRVLIPAGMKADYTAKMPGEIKRKIIGNGDLSLLLFTDHKTVEAYYHHPRFLVDTLSLEDLFIEVVE